MNLNNMDMGNKRPVRVSIPGKVMLSGEYAVLYGGIAVMMPVPRYLDIDEVFQDSDQSITPVINSSLETPIPRISEFEKENGIPLVRIDSSSFNHRDQDGNTVKLGLGSSAAEAVGVIALRYQRAGLDWKNYRYEIANIAFEAHNTAQDGKGSGADVFTSALDQPIIFARTGNIIKVNTFKIDDHMVPELQLNLAWTGIPANTREMVAQFEKCIKSGNDIVGKSIDELIDQSRVVVNSWLNKSYGDVVEEMNKYTNIMNRCAKEAGIPYTTDAHKKIAEWAQSNGGFAKPTGAGGGDMVLLVGDLPLEELEYEIISL